MIDEGLRKLVDGAEAVAFDVFDTLLVRPFLRPEHLFRFLEDAYGATGFAGFRVLAERTARRQCRKEIDLDEIYSFLPEFQEMKEREINAELEFCRPDPRISIIWNYVKSSGKKIFLISDMYLSEEVISEILICNGFEGWDRLFVSDRYSAGKNDGGLYDIVCDMVHMGPDRILMIGDNPHSDVSVAKSKGFLTYRWKPWSELYSEWYPREYAGGLSNPRLSFLAGIDMLSINTGKENYWHMVGRRFAGPLVLAFAMFVKTLDKDYDKLFFCSRDGYSVMKAYGMLGGSTPYEYVYSSRYISVALSDGVLDDRKKCAYVPGFLKACGYNVPDDRAGTEALLRTESDRYSEYLRSCAGDAKRILLIDSTTMNFSAQADISRRLPECEITGCYCSLLRDSEMPYHAFNDRSDQMISWSYVNLCELFLSSSEPHIRAVSGGKPVFAEVSDTDRARMDIMPDLHAGEMEYIADFIRHFGKDCNIIDSRTVDEWFDILIKNEKSSKGPIWEMKWPSDVSNTVYVNLLFRPKELINIMKCKIGSLLKI